MQHCRSGEAEPLSLLPFALETWTRKDGGDGHNETHLDRVLACYVPGTILRTFCRKYSRQTNVVGAVIISFADEGLEAQRGRLIY